MERVGRNTLKAIRHRAKTLSQKKERIKDPWTCIEWDSDPLSDRFSDWIFYAYYSDRPPWRMMQKVQWKDPWHSWQVASHLSVWRCRSYKTLRTERQSCGPVCCYKMRDLKNRELKWSWVISRQGCAIGSCNALKEDCTDIQVDRSEQTDGIYRILRPLVQRIFASVCLCCISTNYG